MAGTGRFVFAGEVYGCVALLASQSGSLAHALHVTAAVRDCSTDSKAVSSGRMGRGEAAKKAMITNPGQLQKNVKRAMRKLLDKKLIDVCILSLHTLVWDKVVGRC